MNFHPFHTLSLVFSLATAVFAVYVVVTIYLQYRKETQPTQWGRLLAAAKDSQTILWNRFVYVLAGVVAQLDNIADFLNAPELKNFIDTWIGNPQLVSAVMLFIAFISIQARLRPASKDPVT